MRIVFDVSALSHPRTGVGNYVRGSLAGLVEAAGDEHEVVAWAPASARGARLIEDALDGVRVERRLQRLPFAHAFRTAWSRLGRPSAERLVGRFDVLHFGDWTHPRTVRMHSAKYRNAARTCDVIFTNSEYTANDVVELLRVPRERLRVAYPGVDRGFVPEGDRADLGRPYALTVATLEPRKNLETLVRAHRLLGGDLALAVAGGAGWGDEPELRGEDVLRLGFVAHDHLPRLHPRADVFV